MKFLAMLKDSFREAIDTKVFYVMVGLSSVVIVLVAGTSFRPAPARDMMELMAQPLAGSNFELLGNLAALLGQSSSYKVEAVATLDGGPETPSSAYRVTLSRHFENEAAAAKARQAPEASLKKLQLLFGSFDPTGELRLLDVSDVQLGPPAPEPHNVLFELTARPTATTRRVWFHQPVLFFGLLPLPGVHMPLGMQVYFIEALLVNIPGAWVAILISIVMTSFFIPNMLRKGTVDLLLVKPLHRATLLLYKYIGGLTFIFLNTTVLFLGVWVALGLRTGLWGTGFLLTIFVITFFFAILYAVSTLFGVLTRSPVVAILMTCAVWFFLFIVGMGYLYLEQSRGLKEYPGWVYATVGTVHYVLPRTKDLDALTGELLMAEALTIDLNALQPKELRRPPLNWRESLIVSSVFIAVMLGLSCWQFARRDY